MSSMDSATIPRWTMGERLAKARKDAGIPQEQMAQLLGVSRRTVVRYEGDDPLGKVRRGLLAQWALVTRTPLWWILDRDPEESEPDSNDRRGGSLGTSGASSRRPTNRPLWAPLERFLKVA